MFCLRPCSLGTLISALTSLQRCRRPGTDETLQTTRWRLLPLAPRPREALRRLDMSEFVLSCSSKSGNHDNGGGDAREG